MIVEFDADPRRAAVKDQIDASAEIGQNVGGRRRADPAGAVRRGRDEGNRRRLDQRPRDRVARRAHGEAGEAGAGQFADAASPRERRHQRQRSRPERLRQRLRMGVENRLAHRGRGVEDMGDERVERRPALGGVERGDGAVVCRVRRQPVDGFGRHRDEAAGAQDRGGFGDRPAVRRQYFRPAV